MKPGYLVSNGTEENLADAEGLLTILRATAKTRARRGAGSMHIAREALWSFWEHPRLPRPLVGNKYPLAYPWSSNARAIYAQHKKRPAGGYGVVLEHLTPRNLLIQELWEAIDRIDEVDLMDHLFTHLTGTIITKDEDDALTAAGVGRSYPLDADPEDVWARYRVIGLAPEDFAVVAVAAD